MKVLICQTRFGIGDCVIFLPYIHAIAKRYGPVTLLAKKSSRANEICKYDKATDIMKVKWIYYSENKAEEEYQFTMRMYYPDTMNRLITDAGLHINNLWGDYQFSEFNESSELQIYECTI